MSRVILTLECCAGYFAYPSGISGFRAVFDVHRHLTEFRTDEQSSQHRGRKARGDKVICLRASQGKINGNHRKITPRKFGMNTD